MSVQAHKKDAFQVNCMIVTISDTRTEATDKSGALMQQLLENAGHNVTNKKIVQDEEASIRSAIEVGCSDPNVDVILTNGGTGIASRDVTIETIQPMLDKTIPGFGEIFRFLSYTEDIGSAAILSRAIAGVVQNTAIFCTPGSTGAVKLAMNKLILPELSHVVHELKKKPL
ncbi:MULTISPECIES: MogA/MoaB family molybdenum cofactor biosynthesis protein [unclassified Virgibacillus]|uniref:MogA/MoaB family molybdenum cofactor biosynthesis protein n=1 Tax=unclassified Virgibacillus TaxID=2620237 RepID=UPI0024DEDB77|nr:MogA/MoaB family molybdenum cofactor biosynthesis protein [Virgibacillus sp. LDC-1]